MSFDFGNLNLSVLAPRFFETASDSPADRAVYESRLAEIQRFRGRIYVEDRAIPADALNEDGRHESAADIDSWHLYLTDVHDRGQGCIRIRRYDWFESPAAAPQLLANHVLERMAPEQRVPYRVALDTFLSRVAREGSDYGEAGGWAVAPELRRSTASLSLALAVWSLSRLLGRTMGVSPTTTKHHTAKIHHRLGGFPLLNDGLALPPFYDAYHKCEMELVAFDSDRLSPRYEKPVRELQEHLLEIATIDVSSCGVGGIRTGAFT